MSGHVSFPKRVYVRNAKLRVAYRLIPCQWRGCGIEDATVCAAHSNWSDHGKGGRIKADDSRAASLCFSHHQALDQGPAMSAQERREGWEYAHQRSVAELVRLGHWPKAVPIPSDAMESWPAWLRAKAAKEYEFS